MNKLPFATRVQILAMLCEGMAMRAVARIADVSFNTVAKAMIDAGRFCAEVHDEMVRDVNAAAGLTTRIMGFEDVLARIDAARAPKIRGPYKKAVAESSN